MPTRPDARSTPLPVEPRRATMTLDEAVRYMRSLPAYADLVRHAYLGPDVLDSAQRFERSGEFEEVRRLLGGAIDGAVVLDVGAGTGIASRAFARSGARVVCALEPDPSDEVGQGAIRRLVDGLRIEIVACFAENIPLETGTADVVYARQVLHHIRNLPAALREFARVLRPGGVLLACREHVVDDDAQLAAFLDSHPMHQLAGGENAYPLTAYTDAIREAGLVLDRRIAPWESVINAFPSVTTQAELEDYARAQLVRRLGRLGTIAYAAPGVRHAVWSRIARPVPGRLYSFLARKP